MEEPWWPRGVSRSMRLLVVIAWLALAPCGAAAQSYYLHGGPLTDGGEYVGMAAEAPVTVRLGPSPTEVRVRFDGPAVTLEADAELSAAHLQAGVGAPVRLRGTAFATTMLANAWAPVRRLDAGGTHIVLPPGAPMAEASIPVGSPGTSRAPLDAPWFGGDTLATDDPRLHCLDFEISARPGHGLRYRVPEGAARFRTGTHDGWDTIVVQHEGFRYTGFRPSRAQCTEGFGGLGLSGTGAGGGDGRSHGRVVMLPAGTELFASPSSATPFATLHVEVVGLEPLYAPPETRCDGAGRCVRSPPLPSGPTRWIVHVIDGGASILLEGWVGTPAEQLPDAPAGHGGGFGIAPLGAYAWP